MDNDEKILDQGKAMAETDDVEDREATEELVAGKEEEVATSAVVESTEEPASGDDLPTDVEEGVAVADEAAAIEDLPEDAEEMLAPASEETAAEPTAEAPVEAAPIEPEAEEVAETVEESEAFFLAAMATDSSMDEGDFLYAPIQRGQIVKGMIAGKSDTEILVDIGAKSEGMITGRELDLLDSSIVNGLQVGDEILVYVLTPEDREGRILLSLRRALEEQDWRDAEEYLKEERSYESKVAGYNKGGLIVPFGKVRGFVPASQVSMDRRRRSDGETPEERWGHMVGEEILIRVIEVDRGRNRLILSERAAEQEQRTKRRGELLETLEIGQRHSGRVVRLTDFGAFVDLGGADGLVHLSELSWQHVTHPREVLRVGEEIEVEVINLDRERQRIGLSHKNCLADPWDTLAAEFHPGQLVQGRVTKMTKFGAFASLVDRPEIEGLIHISELSERRVKHPREVVNEEDVLTLRIIRIEADRRRLGLSLKRVDSEEYLEDDWQDLMSAEDAAEAGAPVASIDEAEEVEVPVASADEAEEAEVPVASADEAEEEEAPVASADEAEEEDAPVASVDEAEEEDAPVASADEAEEEEAPVASADEAEEEEAPVASIDEAEEVEVPIASIDEAEEVEVPVASADEAEEVEAPIASIDEAEEVEVPVASADEAEEEEEPTD